MVSIFSCTYYLYVFSGDFTREIFCLFFDMSVLLLLSYEFFLLLSLTIPLWSEMISILFNYWDLCNGTASDLSYWMLPVYLKKYVVYHCWLQCSTEINEVKLCDSTVHVFYSPSSFLIVLEKLVLKSPTVTMDWTLSPFSSTGFCPMYSWALLLSHILDYCVFIWRTNHFISMKPPSPFQMPALALKSTLSDMSIAIPPFLRLAFAVCLILAFYF